MTLKRSSSPRLSVHVRRNSAPITIPTPDADRARMLADVAASGDEDNAECAEADLAREFDTSLP